MGADGRWCWVGGCLGKMGPTTRRRYRSNAHSLTTDLESNLFWRNAFGRLPPRAIPLTLLLSVGRIRMLEGVGEFPRERFFPNDVSISTHLPKWFGEMAFVADDDESPAYLFKLAADIFTA